MPWDPGAVCVLIREQPLRLTVQAFSEGPMSKLQHLCAERLIIFTTIGACSVA
jgi:hypothetical protein